MVWHRDSRRLKEHESEEVVCCARLIRAASELAYVGVMCCAFAIYRRGRTGIFLARLNFVKFEKKNIGTGNAVV